MRTFKHFNSKSGDVCPVCQTGDDRETVLIPITGTEDGGIMQAKQFHLDCINLLYYPEYPTGAVLAQVIIGSKQK